MRRFFRKGQTGQSIFILALGFVGLAAFVGITVDVSVLFTRYYQLRRAVDSAAIAAAGQMREDRTLADVELTARQFIELHGLDPKTVWVETCANPPIEDTDSGTQGLQPEGGVELHELDPEICTINQRKLIRVTAQIESQTAFLRLVGWGNIRLQASAVSETAVLDVVLVLDVSESMLNETTIEDWAMVNQGWAYVPPVIDFGRTKIKSKPKDNIQENTVLSKMAGITDIPELNTMPKMSGATTYPSPIPTISLPSDSTTPTWIDYIEYSGQAVNPIPVGKGNQTFNTWWEDWFWQELHLNYSQTNINDRLWYPKHDGAPSAFTGILKDDAVMDKNAFYKVESFIPKGIQGTQTPPREECRVRFFPYGRTLDIPEYMRDLYKDNGYNLVWPPVNQGATIPRKWGGFVPTFNYFGCCNDPGTGSINNDGVITPNNTNADGDFSDLVCQPFKQAKDATRQFLSRVDFLRGDRVAFVTFDRGAYIIDPDGENNPAKTNKSHMIEDFQTALNTLNQNIGVRTEPNFYKPNTTSGGWVENGTTQFSAGIGSDGKPITIDYSKVQPNQAILGNMYPVKSNCLYQNATMEYPFSRWSTRIVANPANPLNNQPSLRNVITPDIYKNDFWRIQRSNPTPATGIWNTGQNAYELWGQCRGTNIGAALREANSALTNPDTTRREGAVWVVILLSDGAAGASDPARINGHKPKAPQPYEKSSSGTYDYSSATERHYGLDAKMRGEYGFFGLCPFGPGKNGELGELMLIGEEVNNGRFGFPFCSDESPVTRHFCRPLGDEPGNVGGSGDNAGAFSAGFAPNARDRDYDYTKSLTENRDSGNIYDIDIGNYTNEPNCDPLYDVDDYARDWADFVGGIRKGPQQEGSNSNIDETLPTMFTIGFGLNFERKQVGGNQLKGRDLCNANIEDCLGEELLRYIADVGDNFRVDTDYQQDYINDFDFGGFTDEQEERVGEPGPCEPTEGGYDYKANPGKPELVEIFDPGSSCGNYYNAPGKEELELVFDEIASRMFTRIAG